MNIFIILIVSIMLATYQYFTTKRNSSTVLNKDELAFQSELNCLKDTYTDALLKNSTPTSANPEAISTNTSCAGVSDVKTYKYCVGSNNKKTSCANKNNISKYCISATKWKVFEQDKKYLITVAGKSNIKLVTTTQGNNPVGTIDNIEVILGTKPTQIPTNGTLQAFGVYSCQKKDEVVLTDSTEPCPEGKHKVNGVCVDKAEKVSPCVDIEAANGERERTSQPAGYSEWSANENYSMNGKKYRIVPQESGNIYCIPNPSFTCDYANGKYFDPLKRHWVCINPNEKCRTNGKFQIKSNSDTSAEYTISILGGEKTVTETETVDGQNVPIKMYAWSIDSTGQYCKPIYSKFKEQCQKILKTNNVVNYGFHSIELKADANWKESGTYNNAANVICNLDFKNSAAAAENCNICQSVTYDSTNNKWTCANTTFNTQAFKEILARRINSSGTVDKIQTTSKGIPECFTGCEFKDENGQWVINLINSGKRNGLNWALTFNDKTKMWSCTKCAYNTEAGTVNDQCCTENANGGYDCSTENCKQNKEGKCIQQSCPDVYRILIGGKCYTKWCPANEIPANARLNGLSDHCPSDAPFMVKNCIKKCTYCIKTPYITPNINTQCDNTN